MRFPRNTRIFRGQLDVAPLAGVLFLLVIFLLLSTSLVFVPGVEIQLPHAATLTGVEGPTVVVAIDESGQFYFDNQAIEESALVQKLRAEVLALKPPAQLTTNSPIRKSEGRQSVTLVVKADAKVQYQVLTRLWLLAREAGITNVLQATYRPLVPTPLPSKQ